MSALLIYSQIFLTVIIIIIAALALIITGVWLWNKIINNEIEARRVIQNANK